MRSWGGDLTCDPERTYGVYLASPWTSAPWATPPDKTRLARHGDQPKPLESTDRIKSASVLNPNPNCQLAVTIGRTGKNGCKSSSKQGFLPLLRCLFSPELFLVFRRQAIMLSIYLSIAAVC